ncbi:hypothetical protein [Roseovarius sp. 2305UL8-3]|uniref:hypothetical protein n=1 Tax=Roseovarius conchicola TaxID=3121636 RepID=UPI0035277443
MTLEGILSPCEGGEVGVNVHGSSKIETVVLKEVGSDHFTIFDDADETTYIFPFSQVVHIAVNPKGVSEGRFLFRMKTKCKLFIKLSPAIEFVPG